MSEIAEIRKLFLDLIAPAIKSVAINLDALGTGVDRQFKRQKELIDLQLKLLNDNIEARCGLLKGTASAVP